MSFWKENVDQIISNNDFPLLDHAGSVSHKEMEDQTAERYLDFDQRRRAEEAKQADREDEAELKQIEEKIKKRKT